MATAGLCKPDGSDIRVTTAMGKAVLSETLMTGPGDRARVAFAKQGPLKRYYVYFGNPNPPARRVKLPIRRGVLLETRRCRSDPPNKLEQARRIFEKSGPLIGRRFMDRMFLGYNPFSPEDAIANLLVGYVNCIKSGQYVFSCSSNNASFLLVDDKLLINNGGRHRPQRDIRKNANINLKAGLHKLTFYHINRRGSPVVVVAWRPPGEKRVRVIPPGAFAPVHVGQAGAMQDAGKAFNVDFSPVHAGEAFAANRYSQRFSFTAETVGRGPKTLEWKWDFGDGQTAAAPKIDHVYFTDGFYTVTLRAKVGRRELTRTNRIYVSRPWDKVTRSRIDTVTNHAKIVSFYNFETLKIEAVPQAFELLKRADLTTEMIRACSALLKRNKLSGDGIESIVSTVSDILLKNAQTDNAVKALLVAAEKTDTPDAAARMTIKAADIVLNVQRDPDKAMKLYTRIQGRYGRRIDDTTARDVKIGIGDVWRFRGDYDKAAAAYKTAGFGPEAGNKRHPIVVGNYARHVEAYTLTVRHHEWAQQYLDKWARTFPADKLDGYLPLLTARLWMAQGRYAEIAGEADVLVRVNPTSNYGAELLMLAVQAYGKMDKPAKARETLKRIVEKFPESPLAAEAARSLKKK